MTVEERILVGVVGAPHGIRGEMRLKSFTQQPEAVATYGTLMLQDGRRLTITAARPLRDDMLVVRFAGITDRETAAALTNLQLFVSRDDLPEIEDDEFYHADLIGLAARTVAGAACGRIVALQNFGAGDVLEIAPPVGDTFYVPFTKAFVPVVDVSGGHVVVAEEAMPGGGPALAARR